MKQGPDAAERLVAITTPMQSTLTVPISEPPNRNREISKKLTGF